MTSLQQFDIATSVTDALTDLFESMLSMDLTLSDESEVADLEGARISGSVRLAGKVKGWINLHVSDAFARVMTAAKLGTDVEEIEDEEAVKGVIGEVCHIVGGNLTSKLCDGGFHTRVSTPSLTVGGDSAIEAQNMTRYEKLAFRHNDEFICVEIGLKSDDDMPADTMAGAGDGDAQRTGDRVGADAGETAPPDNTEKASASSPPDSGDTDAGALLDGASACQNLDFLLDVPVAVTVELGRTRKRIEDVLGVMSGSIIELTKLSHEPVDIRVNDTLIAKGEIVVDKDKYGVRILETISRMQRIRSL